MKYNRLKYNRQRFCDCSDKEKLRIVKEELALETHNGTTKNDLLMLLDWAYNRLIKGDLEAREMNVLEKILEEIKDPQNKEGLPSASLVYSVINLLGIQANMIQELQKTIQKLERQSQCVVSDENHL